MGKHMKLELKYRTLKSEEATHCCIRVGLKYLYVKDWFLVGWLMLLHCPGWREENCLKISLLVSSTVRRTPGQFNEPIVCCYC